MIVLAGSSRRQLEEVDTESLEIISEWAHNHRLKLSLKKCFCLRITKGSKFLKNRNRIIS